MNSQKWFNLLGFLLSNADVLNNIFRGPKKNDEVKNDEKKSSDTAKRQENV